MVIKCKISTYWKFKSKDFQVPYLFSRALNYFSKIKHFQGFLKHAMNSELIAYKQGDHSHHREISWHFPDSRSTPACVKCRSYYGMMHVLLWHLQSLYNYNSKCWQVLKWMDTKLKNTVIDSNTKMKHGNRKNYAVCICNVTF